MRTGIREDTKIMLPVALIVAKSIKAEKNRPKGIRVKHLSIDLEFPSNHGNAFSVSRSKFEYSSLL